MSATNAPLEPAGSRAGGAEGNVCGAVIAAAAGLAAAWIAAGSAGLTAHGLRHALSVAALGIAVVAAWPRLVRPGGALLRIVWSAAAVAAAVAMIASPLPAVNVLAAPLLLLVLAQGQAAGGKATLAMAAEAAVVLAVYRTAYTSMSLAWYGADALGGALGAVAGALARRPLWVGATMGGVDYLLPMLYLALLLPLRFRAGAAGWQTARRICCALAVVLFGHLLYLLALAFSADVLAALPAAATGHPPAGYDLPAATPADVLRKLVPWCLPALAAAMDSIIAAGLLYVFVAKKRAVAACPNGPSQQPCGTCYSPLSAFLAADRRAGLAVVAALVCLSAAIPVAGVLVWSRPDLAGKKIVLYEKGFLNWLKPEYGQYGRLSVGMYGMLPTFLESLGARTLISPDLSQEDLQDADALLIIYPNQPWSEEQLRRIDAFVRGGGSLMVMGEHTVREKDGGSRINDVLGPTAMRVPFDSAVFAIGGWLHSYDAIGHPTSTGIGDESNQFGVVIGASVAARWPARPMLVGRWGWADVGDPDNPNAMLGNERYDAGEKLGDVLLAAEQPLGAGKVICFGDPSMLVNGLMPGCHEYTARLFTYLVGGGSTPQTLGRQLSGLAAALLLLGLLVWRPLFWGPAAVALSLATALAVCTAVTHHAWDVLPDGNLKSPNNLAYIDGGHLNADTPESWREDGLGGLELTLIRNGYLPLLLSEATAQRLGRAKLLFVDAPAREYSAREREVVADFVRAGGVLIYAVGWERIGPSRRLLSELGFHVGLPGTAAAASAEKPHPLGYFKSPFFQGNNYYAFVRFHAAWPVYCDDPQAVPVTYYGEGKPVIVARRYGRGAVAVIGDTCFAMNKNLEHEDGSPFEGMRENAVFWRWFLPLLTDAVPWYPPKPAVEPADKPAPAPSE